MSRGTFFLMYHELEVPGRSLCRADPGYTRYVVKEETFRDQLARLHALGVQGMSVTEALAGASKGQPGLAITFDDGCETDLLVAAPLLREAGFRATFYVVAGFVGRPGYLSGPQIRQLQDLGFEIGCHSMTHAYLADLAGQDLHAEIVEAKERLEKIAGKRIEHFSCPGGRWSRQAADVARAAGYRSMATSQIGRNSPHANLFRLARVAVHADTTVKDITALLRGRGLLWRRLRDGLLATAKGLLGTSWYEGLRSAVLGGGPPPSGSTDHGQRTAT
jgi:peptidoglycan/xylan/chitin deacetylase (PgdA/CDA1 family)